MTIDWVDRAKNVVPQRTKPKGVKGYARPAYKIPKRRDVLRIKPAVEPPAKRAIKRDVIYLSCERIKTAVDLLQEIKEDVARAHGVTVEIIDGPSRTAKHVAARHEAIYKAHMALAGRMSLPKLGQNFGGRDHSTIYHALRKYQA